MKFVFTDKKVNLPNYIHNYAEKKVGKLDRFFKEDATAALTFSIEKDRNQVEVTIRSSGTIFRVSESTADMRASIDAAVASLERQIRKNKTRLEKRLRQGAFERTVDAAAEISSFVPDEPEEGEYVFPDLDGLSFFFPIFTYRDYGAEDGYNTVRLFGSSWT